MFGLCTQSLYYLLISIIIEICGMSIIGFDVWLNNLKHNYIFIIASLLIYLVIIQLLCFFNKNTAAWVLFWITFTLNIISLLVALGNNIPEDIKKKINDRNIGKASVKKTFDENANKSCKTSCDETCANNRNKPIDFDCNSYCNSECNKIF